MTRNDMAALIVTMYPSFSLHNGVTIPRAYLSTDIAGDITVRSYFRLWRSLDGHILWDRKGFHQLRRLPKLALAQFIVCNWELWVTERISEFRVSGVPTDSEKSLYEDSRLVIATVEGCHPDWLGTGTVCS